MRICLLTQHPETFSSRRLLEEAKRLGAVTVLDPLRVRIARPAHVESFDLTLNRVAAVEADSFLATLLQLPQWGRQSNAWETRQQLWDKTRQALWLEARGLPFVPFFAHRGPLTPQDPDWRAFAEAHASERGWVLKVNRGLRGIGVHFIADTRELFAWLETFYRLGDQDFLVQPRLAPGPEFRLTLLGTEVWALLERTGSAGPANFAQGGSARELASPPAELRALVERLSALRLADLACLDILVGPQGPLVSDVNLVPGFEQLEAVTGRNLGRAYLGQLLHS